MVAGCLTSYDALQCGGNKREYGDSCSGDLLERSNRDSGREKVAERICTKEDENGKTIYCDKDTGCCKEQDVKTINCIDKCFDECDTIEAAGPEFDCAPDASGSGCYPKTITCNDKSITSAICMCKLIVWVREGGGFNSGKRILFRERF